MKKAEILAEQERLTALANELTCKHWGVDFSGTFSLQNRRWRCRRGCFVYNKTTGLCEIRMCAQHNSKRTPADIEKTLLHELVHWRLFVTGQPFGDTDNTFIAECLRVGASISQAASAQDAYKRYLDERSAA